MNMGVYEAWHHGSAAYVEHFSSMRYERLDLLVGADFGYTVALDG